MASSTATRSKARSVAPELPAPGYPVSEEAVEYWFRQHHGRAPAEQELGAIMGEMAKREATPPRRGPDADPRGWATFPAAPATRPEKRQR
jgi:hypothetical protein